MRGIIDEVRIFNLARSQAEIQSDMNSPLGADTFAPVLSNGQPTGSLASGTSQTAIGVTTGEAATCRYETTAGVSYTAMTNTFMTTGATTHQTTVSGLSNGAADSYYVRCRDSVGNANTSDFVISFSVGTGDATPPVRSNGLPNRNAGRRDNADYAQPVYQ